ncbi:hypothetical protein [Oceanicola sp. S124]|uniref:hypothetical protein n=1 Tax=Oceanicola sp. S124 TaxID=1042378 RepID=UPI00025596B8|nr:hypothetical protein [Oceanicola sp. S124]
MKHALRPALLCLLLLVSPAAAEELSGDASGQGASQGSALGYGSAYQQERLRIERERAEALRSGDAAELADLDRQRRLLRLRLQDALRPQITPGRMPPKGSTSGLKIPGITSP